MLWVLATTPRVGEARTGWRDGLASDGRTARYYIHYVGRPLRRIHLLAIVRPHLFIATRWLGRGRWLPALALQLALLFGLAAGHVVWSAAARLGESAIRFPPWHRHQLSDRHARVCYCRWPRAHCGRAFELRGPCDYCAPSPPRLYELRCWRWLLHGTIYSHAYSRRWRVLCRFRQRYCHARPAPWLYGRVTERLRPPSF